MIPAPASVPVAIPLIPVGGTETPWELGPNVPRTSGTLLRRLSYRAMRAAGWDVEGAIPDLARFVIVVAPHTSNWDFIVGLAAKWSLGLRVRFIGKHSLFYPPLGWFMRAIGGVPVVRTERNNLVEQSIHEFAARDQFLLVLAPEGTRKRVEQWKSGFWHIARRANVPICCVALDYARKRVRLGPTFMTDTEDATEGVRRVRAMYDDVRGYDVRQQ